MPINPKLKEHLEKNVQMDDAYRKKLVETLEDAPADIQNLWMAQQDYTRQMNAFKDEQKTWKAEADKFYNTSNTNIDLWKAAVQKANDDKAAIEAEIAQLRTGSGGGTPVENAALDRKLAGLEALVIKVQTAMDEKLKAIVTAPDLDKAYGNAVGFLGEQLLTLNEISARHQEQFGKRMSKEEATALIAFTNEESKKLGHTLTLEEAYQRKMGTEIAKLHDDEIARKAIEQYKSTHEVPGAAGTGGSGMPEKGPLQIRLDQIRNAENGKKDGVYGDWREAAAAGAEELVKEGKY